MSRADSPSLPAWVGEIDVDVPVRDLVVDRRFRGARLLCTRSGSPVAVVDVDLQDGRLGAEDLEALLAGVTASDAAPRPAEPAVLPSATVAVCTRNRPEFLAIVLEHLRAQPDDDVQFLIVDNAPSDDRSRDLVTAVARDEPRLHYVREERAGLSRARNRALAEADGDVLAFVDDDVRMRPGWLTAVRTAFTHPDVVRPACVTGPVYTGALENLSQLTSEAALRWTAGFEPRRFSLAEPSPSPLFPFKPGEFGVGANMAVDRAVARDLGGFDVGLGAGSPTRGGEDIEFWVRLIVAGHTLAYEPSAWLWHHHRDSEDAVREQLSGYARGLGGFLGAVMRDPAMRRLALRRTPAAVSHLLRLRRSEAEAGVPAAEGGLAPAAVLTGAVTYLRSAVTPARAAR